MDRNSVPGLRDGVLCDVCASILVGHPPETYFYTTTFRDARAQLHTSIEQLTYGIKKNCDICIRISGLLIADSGRLEDLSEFGSVCTFMPQADGKRDLALQLTVTWKRTNGKRDYRPAFFNLCNLSIDLDRCKKLRVARLDDEMSSASVVNLMRKWYHNCKNNHTRCTWRIPNSASGWRPTRLLDIGPPGSLHWHLDEQSEEKRTKAEFTYVTLSHRWGTSSFPVLDTSTREKFKSPNLIADLPQTFKDAVQVAHLLSIRYLWIDSLCIQQDSKEDWQREALAMRQVYACSACNVVEGQPDCNPHGLFRRRDPVVSECFKLRTCWDNEGSNAEYLVWDGSTLQGEFKDAPLTERGWVFQERLLPARLIQFGKHQIFWRCGELFASESLPDGIPTSDMSYSFSQRKDLSGVQTLMAAERLSVPRVMPHEISQLWKHLVQDYSSCKLTFSKDKLIALSGIAKVFKELTGDQYLAGLWRSRVVDQLCWTTEGNNTDSRTIFREPTWSWATVDLPLKFDKFTQETRKDLIELLDGSITPMAENDNTGAVSAGSLTVSGWLSSFKIENPTFMKMYDIRFRINGNFASINGSQPVLLDYALGDKVSEMDLWLLPLVASVEEQVSLSYRGVRTCGLILQLRESNGQQNSSVPVYRRVGHFDFSPQNSQGNTLLGASHNHEVGMDFSVAWNPTGTYRVLQMV